MIASQRFVPEFPLADLTEHPENPRRGNVEAIGESMEANGFYGAVVVQEATNRIIVGNHRARVAAALGEEYVPALVLDIDDAAARKIMLADNRTNDLAFYDDRQLLELLQTIEDLAGTGFNEEDLNLLLAKIELDEEPIVMPDAPSFPSLVTYGDVWRVGPCQLICGDSRDPAVVEQVLEGAKVTVAFTSPPYADRRTYDKESEFRPIHPRDYVSWFKPCADNIHKHLTEDGSWFVNIRTGADDGVDMETYVLDLVLAHVREWGFHWGSEYVWERIGVPKEPKRRFKSAFEMVYHFSIDRWKWRPDAVRHYSSDVPQPRGPMEPGEPPRDWSIAGHGQPGKGRFFVKNEHEADLAYPSNRLPTFSVRGEHVATGHPAAFPPALPRFFILAYSDPGDAVYDPFVGSGSTLLAAASEGRDGYGVEISPHYCDIALSRLRDSLGFEPELVSRRAA